jgi:hypothetical protein
MNLYHRYVRHSASSKEQQHSQAAQGREIAEYIKSLSVFASLADAGEYYDEEISGGMAFGKRPAGAILLQRCQPGDHIVVARFDRMCRKVKDLLWMIDWCNEHKVTLHIVDKRFDLSTATGRAMAQMCAVFAEWELGTCGERQRQTNKAVKYTKGIAVCLAQPIGWKRVRRHKELNTLGHPYMTLVPFGLEREEAKKLKAMRDSRGWGCDRIATYLNNLPTPSIPVRCHDKGSSRRWSPAAVRQRIQACEKGFPAPPDCIDGRNTEQLTIEVQR